MIPLTPSPHAYALVGGLLFLPASQYKLQDADARVEVSVD